MSKYLHTGWHEFFLPVMSRHGRTHLRIWIDMADLLPMLRELDLVYGDRDHPYALRTEEIPDAQRKLLELVTQHVLHQPRAVRRVACSRQLAAELHDRFGVQPSDYPLRYPEVIDQVDLDPEQATLALPFIVERTRRAEP
jgi:hypothetical protein